MKKDLKMKCECGSVQPSVRSSVRRSVCLFDTRCVHASFVLSMLLFGGLYLRLVF